MIKKLLFIILAVYSFAPAQNESLREDMFPVIIDSIQVIGHEITEPDIILRELTFGIGDSVSRDDLDYNRDRIYSLGIFTRVDLLIETMENYNKLIIWVEESWYIYPIPFAELKDRDWDKISYGLDIYVKNFRGRNETISGRAAFGYDPSFALSYYNPLLVTSEDIFFGINLFYLNARNKSKLAEQLYGSIFDQKFINGSITIGKRFGLYNKLALFGTYNYVETPVFIPGVSASDDRIDRVPSLGIQYSYDTRDLAQFPRTGIHSILSAEVKGAGINDVSYLIYSLDFREYRKLWGDLGSKWRIAARITAGDDVPFYDHSFLGFSERVRGHYENEREGNSLYIASAELNYPIIKDVNLNFDFIPIVPDELLHYRVALYVQLFADAGTTLFKGENVALNKFNRGYGMGLTFLVLPYNLARIEAALDEFGNLEWILDLGISF